MEITEYRLTLTCKIGNEDITKEIIYRGNENVLLRCGSANLCIDKDEKIDFYSLNIPRHILECFMRMINDN